MYEPRPESGCAHRRAPLLCAVLLLVGAQALAAEPPGAAAPGPAPNSAAKSGAEAPDSDEVRPRYVDAAQAESLRATLAELVAPGAEDGSSLLLGLDALHAALDPEQRALLDSLERAAGGGARPGPPKGVELVRLEGQLVKGAEAAQTLPLALLPAPVLASYEAMSRAMEAELGRRLLVGSGYRSHAYQLFVFASYLPVADYSVAETLRHVSLPSEHSQPERQGVDFVSQSGVDLLYSNPDAFRALPEYRWLQQHGARFGFFPLPAAEAAGSPWHWHWEP